MSKEVLPSEVSEWEGAMHSHGCKQSREGALITCQALPAVRPFNF